MRKEALGAIKEALDEYRGDLAEVDRRLQPLQAEREGLVQTIAALEATVARFENTGTTPVTAKGDWTQVSRPDAIYKLLHASPGAMSTKEVTAALAERGRSDSSNGVYTALDRLRKRGLVVNLGKGLWTLKERVRDTVVRDGALVSVTEEGRLAIS